MEPQFQPPPPTRASLDKRERKGALIADPTTGRAFTEQELHIKAPVQQSETKSETHPHSDSSSLRNTPSHSGHRQRLPLPALIQQRQPGNVMQHNATVNSQPGAMMPQGFYNQHHYVVQPQMLGIHHRQYAQQQPTPYMVYYPHPQGPPAQYIIGAPFSTAPQIKQPTRSAPVRTSAQISLGTQNADGFVQMNQPNQQYIASTETPAQSTEPVAQFQPPPQTRPPLEKRERIAAPIYDPTTGRAFTEQELHIKAPVQQSETKSETHPHSDSLSLRNTRSASSDATLEFNAKVSSLAFGTARKDALENHLAEVVTSEAEVEQVMKKSDATDSEVVDRSCFGKPATKPNKVAALDFIESNPSELNIVKAGAKEKIKISTTNDSIPSNRDCEKPIEIIKNQSTCCLHVPSLAQVLCAQQNEEKSLESNLETIKDRRLEYRSDFLRSLQNAPESLRKPDIFPKLDIMHDIPVPQREPNEKGGHIKSHSMMHPGKYFHAFLPHVMSSNRKQGPQMKCINERSSQHVDQVRTINAPLLKQNVKLHTVENPWKAEIVTEEAKTLKLMKALRGILNKLTPQNYQKLLKKVKKLTVDTEERLQGIVGLIVDKALMEPMYSLIYANLCEYLASNLKAVHASNDENTTEELEFGHLLLTRCLKELESKMYERLDVEGKQAIIDETTDEEKKTLLIEELDEEKRKARKRSLGNIKFIGELYLLGMLKADIMMSCIEKLLLDCDEESLECLCTLLMTIGLKLQNDVKEFEQKNLKLDRLLSLYFSALVGFVNEKKISARVRFMIQDVLDMRDNGWQERDKRWMKSIDTDAEGSRINNQHDKWSSQPMDQLQSVNSPLVTHDVKLHAVENPWKAQKVTDTSTEEAKTTALMKAFRGILNKLTPQKYQQLLEEVKKLTIDTEQRLQGILELIFDKAVDQPAFCLQYANLCLHLASNLKAVNASNYGNGAGKELKFTPLLLTRCQKEFESKMYEGIDVEGKQAIIDETTDEEKKMLLIAELDEEKRKARKRSLGNIKLIGELYLLGMLKADIMMSCVERLLRDSDEESLECLCTLLKTIGLKLENDVKEFEQKKNLKRDSFLSPYFSALVGFVNEKKTSAKVRFMIQDVLDMRDNGWKERDKRRQEEDVPMKYYLQEKRRESMKNSGDYTNTNSKDMNMMPKSLKNTTTEHGNMQFGPGNFGAFWSQGSRGGSQQKQESQMSSNRQMGNRPTSIQQRDSAKGPGRNASSHHSDISRKGDSGFGSQEGEQWIREPPGVRSAAPPPFENDVIVRTRDSRDSRNSSLEKGSAPSSRETQQSRATSNW